MGQKKSVILIWNSGSQCFKSKADHNQTIFKYKRLDSTWSKGEFKTVKVKWYQHITLWHSTFWQKPAQITVVKQFEKYKPSLHLFGQPIEVLHDVQKLAKVRVPYIHILNIINGIYFSRTCINLLIAGSIIIWIATHLKMTSVI